MKHFQFLFLILFILFNNVANAQVNNTCANASIINTDSACVSGTSSLTAQTLTGATADGYNITSSCGVQSTYQDVWYKFVAKTKTPTITVSNIGTGWGGITNVGIELLSGDCGSFTEVACASGATLTPSLNNFLVEGTTYYVRIHRNSSTAPKNSTTFDICITDALTRGSRMNEIFSRTVLSNPGVLQYPWEITYGPDDSLWVTEAKGYKVYKISPTSGVKRTVLDLSFGSTWFGTADDSLSAQQSIATWSSIGSPQGGFAGLALHPKFGDGSGNDYVYVTYVWKYISGNNPDGIFYQNKLVRLKYNNTTGRLQNPAIVDNNLPGSTDHNSQRLIIAPTVKNGTPYLFMAQGDMGAGQFANRYRPNNAQNTSSQEGKILRYNLDSIGQPGTGYAKWLPTSNPYTTNKSIYSIGIRNNQGFAYDSSTNILYGASHGPYSDDEINIIESAKNYGHPLVIGYAADGNYNGASSSGTSTSISAGSSYKDCDVSGYTPPVAYTSPYCGKSSIAPIGNEINNMNAINAAAPDSYRDPLFSAYPSISATITNTWQNNPSNGGWESEAWSGLDIYSNKIIPGWNRSLVAAGLKWGRLIKLNLDATGSKTLPSGIGGAVGNAGDTVTYFQSTNRYRDLAFAPNGKDLFLVMDNSSATSGPGTANPTSPACPGCVVKYSFLGYADAAGLSTIPKSINVTAGILNSCNAGTPITIDGSNNFLWIPITGPDGNIMAEINAMGQSLGLVTSSFYKNGSAVRSAGGVKYLDRNITITPTVKIFATPVKVRLYISKVELDALIAASGVTGISNLKILKNSDVCSSSLGTSTTTFIPVNTSTDLLQGSNGYVLQTAVPGFSTFYFASNNIVLPVDLTTFTGALQNDLSTLLNWKTGTEINVAGFDVERSVGGNIYNKIGFVKSEGNINNGSSYSLTDKEAIDQQSLILYYRLKIIDKDGSFKYSNIITITLPITKAIITIAPNPVMNDLKGSIISPITGNVMLSIFDNTGRLILQTTSYLKKGTNSFTQNINQLSSGLYYIDLSAKGIIARTKFQKL